jgi:hypothetical protein
MLTILPYLLMDYGRSKCTLLLCPVFGERLTMLPMKVVSDAIHGYIVIQKTPVG